MLRHSRGALPASPEPPNHGHGLRLVLSSDRTVITAGEPVAYTLRLLNEADSPVRLSFPTTLQQLTLLIWRGEHAPTRPSERPVGGDIGLRAGFASFSEREMDAGEEWVREAVWTPRRGFAPGPTVALGHLAVGMARVLDNKAAAESRVSLRSNSRLVRVSAARGVGPAGLPFAHTTGPILAPVHAPNELSVNNYLIHTVSDDAAIAGAADWAQRQGVSDVMHVPRVAPRYVMARLTEAAVASLRTDPRVARIEESH